MDSSPINGKLLSKTGETEYGSVDAPVILVYFSAHWCPPCRQFTPELAKLYNQWNLNEKQVEIIFVSLDRDEKSYKEYFSEMPWLAIPFGDTRIGELKKLMGIQGIPSLILVDKDGTIVQKKGVEIVINYGEDAIAEFKKY